MTDGLFHIDGDDTLTAMHEAPYDAEDILQELIERHPDLLAGGQMTPDDPRRWLLVRREQGVPDSIEGGGRWSVDHLFVDQDAVPTLIEVKRSTDTRIRREVVGQMLDYAANGVRYWPAERLQSDYLESCRRAGVDPEAAISTLTADPAMTVETFFVKVADHLRAGRIRMVFVADVIPTELRAIVEFLGEQLNPADIFAVEVKQYVAEGHGSRVIVPAVVGRTAAAEKKASPARPPVDRADKLARSLPETREVCDRLIDLAATSGWTAREAPAGLIVQAVTGEVMTTLYFADFDSIDIPIGALRSRGWVSAADRLHDRLRRLTAKRLTEIAPNLPTADVLAHWDAFVDVLRQIANLYESD